MIGGVVVSAYGDSELVLHHAYRAAGGARGQRRIGFQRHRNLAGALGGLPGLVALREHGFASALQFQLLDPGSPLNQLIQ